MSEVTKENEELLIGKEYNKPGVYAQVNIVNVSGSGDAKHAHLAMAIFEVLNSDSKFYDDYLAEKLKLTKLTCNKNFIDSTIKLKDDKLSLSQQFDGLRILHESLDGLGLSKDILKHIKYANDVDFKSSINSPSIVLVMEPNKDFPILSALSIMLHQRNLDSESSNSSAYREYNRILNDFNIFVYNSRHDKDEDLKRKQIQEKEIIVNQAKVKTGDLIDRLEKSDEFLMDFTKELGLLELIYEIENDIHPKQRNNKNNKKKKKSI